MKIKQFPSSKLKFFWTFYFPSKTIKSETFSINFHYKLFLCISIKTPHSTESWAIHHLQNVILYNIFTAHKIINCSIGCFYWLQKSFTSHWIFFYSKHRIWAVKKLRNVWGRQGFWYEILFYKRKTEQGGGGPKNYILISLSSTAFLTLKCEHISWTIPSIKPTLNLNWIFAILLTF